MEWLRWWEQGLEPGESNTQARAERRVDMSQAYYEDSKMEVSEKWEGKRDGSHVWH